MAYQWIFVFAVFPLSTKGFLVKYLFQTGALIGFGLTIIPPILAYNRIIDLEMNKSLLLAGAIIWFAFAPLVLKKKKVN